MLIGNKENYRITKTMTIEQMNEIALPFEIIDNILCLTNEKRLILPFEKILSKGSLKQLLNDISIDMECKNKKVSLKIIKLLFEIGEDCTEDAMIYASENGNLDVVVYLHLIGKTCTNAIDYASANGHLDVVMFLHEIGEDSEDAMIYASENGHLDVVVYLNLIGKECTNAIDYASRNGHLDIVKYLYSIGKKCTTKTMCTCIYMKLKNTMKRK